MASHRNGIRQVALLALGLAAPYACGRTELDESLGFAPESSVLTGGASTGKGGTAGSTWIGGASTIPRSTTAMGGRASGGYSAIGGTRISSSSNATGGRASGGYIATGGTAKATGGRASGGYVATGGITSGGYVASGGRSLVSSTNTSVGITSGGYVPTGGIASGGYVTSGGATTSPGGSMSSGGTLSTGGATSIHWTTVTSWSEAYQCQATQPSNSDPCECGELPCICTYSYYSVTLSGECSQGNYICQYASATIFACFGGVWRQIGGGGGSGCGCDDPNRYFGTGGAPSTGVAPSTGGASSTGGSTSSGGTSATSTSTTQLDASTTGGTSSNTAPTITSTGGSYSCPTTEPHQPEATCVCDSPPCECNYTYAWRGESSCPEPTPCEQSLTFSYTCDAGTWQSTGPSWGRACDCVLASDGN